MRGRGESHTDVNVDSARVHRFISINTWHSALPLYRNIDELHFSPPLPQTSSRGVLSGCSSSPTHAQKGGERVERKFKSFKGRSYESRLILPPLSSFEYGKQCNLTVISSVIQKKKVKRKERKKKRMNKRRKINSTRRVLVSFPFPFSFFTLLLFYFVHKNLFKDRLYGGGERE